MKLQKLILLFTLLGACVLTTFAQRKFAMGEVIDMELISKTPQKVEYLNVASGVCLPVFR